MAALTWDETGARLFETGTSHGALYVKKDDGTYEKGVAWNGLTAVTESPGGAEATDLYADDMKYASMRSAETFGGTIEAYTYPDEFMECDGSYSPAKGVSIGQQGRKSFGLVFKTLVGSDTSTDLENMYKLHIIYNATASPSERSYQTVNDSPDAVTFSWEFETTPVPVTGHKPTSCITIDTSRLDETGKGHLTALEEALYGNGSTEPELPTPDEVISLITTGKKAAG